MGDSSNNQDTAESSKDAPNTESIMNALHSSKPSENIAITEKSPIVSEEKLEKIHDQSPSTESQEKVETFFDNRLDDPASVVANSDKIPEEISNKPSEIKEDTSTSQVTPTNLEKRTRLGSAASGVNQSERMLRNQSDIFSLKDQTTIASAIFSINGSPSRKVFRRKELTASNVFPFGQMCKEDPPSDKLSSPIEKPKESKESYNELKRPSSSLRNPLTGTGLNSNDEYKFKGSKRKDGNPLLGLGYSPEVTPSTHRIPPGGFSHKLW